MTNALSSEAVDPFLRKLSQAVRSDLSPLGGEQVGSGLGLATAAIRGLGCLRRIPGFDVVTQVFEGIKRDLEFLETDFITGQRQNGLHSLAHLFVVNELRGDGERHLKKGEKGLIKRWLTVCIKARDQSADYFGIEALPARICSLMQRLMQVGRDAQRCANVVVLSHGRNSTRRLQNGIDTKMKPIYINCTASF